MSGLDLNGRVALVTGGSRGLGRAIARALADAGASVVLAARDDDALADAAREIEERRGTAMHHVCDVAREDSVQSLCDAVRQRFGRLHILVNNAGVNRRKPITEFTLDEWRSVLDTNLTGAFLVARAFIPLMRGHGYGRLINLTSIMSHVALPGRTAYAASKAGLLGFTKALALELAPDGITVNGISPGPIATAMNTPILQDPETNQQFIARLPVGRWGREEEVARLALHLCSPEAGFITGTDLVIDGGWTAQ
ncbi:MAG: 3-oxoacyl-ACP reductase FabG [Verrucomicrobiales bacterium]|nr:3-oxoacyl-ACP reductase FabG [Verrucomicrobiales bacterium]MCP5526704.1 3-oxoacyl-ACP reductase FabG [Verrucomicrobiales bacterium]